MEEQSETDCLILERAETKVKEKMQSALSNVDHSVERTANGGNSSLSSEVLDLKNDNSIDDQELSAVIVNCRGGYLIFTYSLGPDNQKFIPVLALRTSDPGNQSGSGGHSDSDNRFIAFPLIPDNPQIDSQSTRGAHLANRAHFTRLLMAGDDSQSSAQGQSRYRRLLNRRAKAASKISETSQDISTVSSDSSILIGDASKSSCSTDPSKDKRKADKPVKRSSKKKAKKRGKRCKPVCFAESSGVEAFCVGSICQSSLSEAGANTGLAWDDRSTSDKSIDNGPPHDICMDRSDNEKNNSSNINLSEISTTSMSYASAVEELEVASPIPQGFLCDVDETGFDNDIEVESKIRSTSDCKVTDFRQKRTDFSSKAVTDAHNGSMMDLISDGWNSDFSASGENFSEEKLFIGENYGISISGPFDGDSTQERLGRRHLFQNSLSNDAVNVDNQADRTECDPQGCPSSDFHLVSKRGKQKRKQFGSSNGVNRFNNGGNAHSRWGKEKTNSNSVWQQVQKAPPVGSTIISDTVPHSNGNHNSTIRTVEKMKRKNVGPKQENTCHSRKRAPAQIYVTKSSRDARTNTRQEEASDIPSEVDHHKGILSSARSHKYCLPESIQDLQACVDGGKQLERASTQVLHIDDHSNTSENWLLSGTAMPSDPKPFFEVHSDGSLRLPFNSEPARSQAEISHAENVKQEHRSGCVPQKGMPARSDAEMTAPSGSGNSLTSYVDESDNDESKAINKVRLSSSVCSFVSSMDVVVKSDGSSRDIRHPAPNDEVQTENLESGNASTTDKLSCTGTVPYLANTHEPKYANKCVPETILNMTQAIEDSYRTQLASEGVQKATGRPLAEFERLLYSASPYIGQGRRIGKCKLCSCNQFTDACTCLHEIPNISLGSLWQWYERHGSYGLEVKAEEIASSKRTDATLSEFRAYFVPYLSAVQLFGRGCSMNSCKATVVRDALKAHETKSTKEDCHLTMHSVLISQPLENQTLQPQNLLSTSEMLSASSQEWFSSPFLRTTCFDDSQLLFEFFESGQPQHRPPLFEKIKELIRGEVTSQGRAYGDPATLESLHLHDIHPASWYSVAWYPIYRIPDASFRASFLTFHSFGQLIRRSSSSDCFDGDSSIFCPAVGLQSYNSQNECWFQPRQRVATRAEQMLNYSELLKYRLRTLEETANVMARGVVRKGNERATNRQPDYEFFLSRRRW